MRFAIPIFIMVMVLFTTSMYKESGGTQQEMNALMYNTTETVMNITNDIPFKNPFNATLTPGDYVINFAHAILYTVLVQFLTFMGMAVNVFWEKLSSEFFANIMRLGLVVFICWIISLLFKPILATYVLISDVCEEKNLRIKWYLRILLTMIVWIVIAMLIVMLVKVIF